MRLFFGSSMVKFDVCPRLLEHRVASIAKFCFPLGLLFLGIDSLAVAQMFGDRNVGQPLNRRNPLSVAAESDVLTGSERFLRDNRNPRQFIGGAPADGGFVGMVEAGDPTIAGAQAAVLPVPSIRPDRSAIINRPINPRRPNSLISPQLSWGGRQSSQASVEIVEQTQASLERLLTTRFSTQFEVSVVGSMATLRGVAQDREQRELVEIMTAMEPGINEIQNQIVVNPEPVPAPQPTRQPTR